MQHAAHHSRPRPPPGDSLDDNHTVKLPEYTVFQLTANRRTHYPASSKKDDYFQWVSIDHELAMSSNLPDRGGSA